MSSQKKPSSKGNNLHMEDLQRVNHPNYASQPVNQSKLKFHDRYMTQGGDHEVTKENFLDIIRQLKDVDNLNSKQKIRRLAMELEDGTEKLFAYREYLDQLKQQTIKRIENLSQIELSLFERELSLDSKAIKAERAAPEGEGEAQMLKTQTQQIQTENSPSLELIEREFLLKQKEDLFQIKELKLEQKRSQMQLQFQEMNHEIKLQKNQLNSLQMSLEQQQEQYTHKLQAQMKYPMICLTQDGAEIASYIETLNQMPIRSNQQPNSDKEF